MALTTETRNLEYALDTTPVVIVQPYGRRTWTVGNTSGSNVFILVGPSDDADAPLVAFTGTETQLKALCEMMVEPFARAIIPADVPHVALCTGTGFTGSVRVQAGEQDPPEPAYVATAVNLAKNGTRDMLAAPGASTQTWLYALAGTTDGLGSALLLDDTPTSHSGVMPFGALGGIVMPHTEVPKAPWVKCSTNKKLQMTLAAGGDFDGIMITAPVTV